MAVPANRRFCELVFELVYAFVIELVFELVCELTLYKIVNPNPFFKQNSSESDF